MMSAADHLGTYAEGWAYGNSDTILSATSEIFVFDDPNTGKATRSEFARAFADLKEAVATIRGADHEGPFMELSEVVTSDDGDELTASCWWEIPGTGLQGSGLIKVRNDGVVSERIAYYTKLPE